LKKGELLTAAAEDGVERRIGNVTEKTDGKGRKKKRQGEEAVAWEWLVESGERILKSVRSLEGESEAGV